MSSEVKVPGRDRKPLTWSAQHDFSVSHWLSLSAPDKPVGTLRAPSANQKNATWAVQEIGNQIKVIRLSGKDVHKWCGFRKPPKPSLYVTHHPTLTPQGHNQLSKRTSAFDNPPASWAQRVLRHQEHPPFWHLSGKPSCGPDLLQSALSTQCTWSCVSGLSWSDPRQHTGPTLNLLTQSRSQ